MLNVLNNKFIRFLVVGFINTGISIATIFILFNMFKIGYFLSTLIGYLLGNILSFVLNRYFTFKHNGNIFHSYMKYLIVFIISYIFFYYSSKGIIKFLEANRIFYEESILTYENVGIFCGMGINIFLNYLGNYLFTFKK